MAERTVEDRLREEYSDLLPKIRLVLEHLETKIRHCVLSVVTNLEEHEQLIVTVREKECESAIESLRRRQEGGAFDLDQPEIYSLTDLKDLAGVRVLVFPGSRLHELNIRLRDQFPDWTADPVPDDEDVGDPLAFKYYGFLDVSSEIICEYQVVSMLIGQFWNVEHSAMYKPDPKYRGIARSLEMKERRQEVYTVLREFESTFEKLIKEQ